MGEGEYTTKSTAVVTGGAEVPAIGPNPRRVALIVSSAGLAGSVTIRAVGAPDAAHSIGSNMQQPLMLTYHDFGPLVGYGWALTGSGAGQTVWFLEVLFNGKG